MTAPHFAKSAADHATPDSGEAIFAAAGRRKIIFVGTAHDNGGTSILAAQLADTFRAKGHHVEVWYLFGSDTTLWSKDTRVFYRGKRTSSPLQLVRTLASLSRSLRREAPEVVIGLQPLSNLVAGICGRLSSVPLRIATLHLPRDEANPLLMLFDRVAGAAGFYTQVVACADNVAESYRNNGRTYNRRLVVIPNGQAKPRTWNRTEARAKLSLPSGKIVGQIGRMHEHKNQLFSVDLLTRLPDISLLLLGTGPTEQEVHSQIQSAHVGDRVHFKQALPHAEIGLFYSAVDLILFPSRYEGLSLAAIEAIHARVPLLCSDIPSFRELFGDSPLLTETLLVPLEERGRWVARAQELLRDGDLRRSIADELARLSDAYSFETMAQRYLALLEKHT